MIRENSSKSSEQAKKVMVFGVFDRLHNGHIHFLNGAKKYGELIVVVARDTAVSELKKRSALQDETERIKAIKKLSIADEVILGDKIQGSYEVIKKNKPDIICLGYDQDWLENDLKKKIEKGILAQIKLIKIDAYRPEELHSSLLHNKISL